MVELGADTTDIQNMARPRNARDSDIPLEMAIVERQNLIDSYNLLITELDLSLEQPSRVDHSGPGRLRILNSAWLPTLYHHWTLLEDQYHQIIDKLDSLSGSDVEEAKKTILAEREELLRLHKGLEAANQ